ncbi:MAG: amino acid ABC transporter substrate-binding protein [Rhodoferax sp.]|nr:MAG: amino acid ABC transporter substrate-binding protein [Rhodoferax sp.]
MVTRCLLPVFALATCVAFSAGAEPPKDRLAQVETSKTLRVCIWPDYYGISYRNPKSLQLTGIDIDNAQALAKELGAQVQFVDSSFAKLVDDVTADKCDLAMFAVGITPARQEKLRFTQPHLVSDIYGITTRTNRRIQSWADIDRPGVVVAVAKGTLHEPVMKAKLQQAELLVVDTPAAREQEVQSGRADVFMTDYPFSRRMLDNSEWARLVSPTETYHLTPYGWAMAYGDDRFYARIDKALGDMKRDGRLLANARRHGLEAIVAK